MYLRRALQLPTGGEGGGAEPEPKVRAEPEPEPDHESEPELESANKRPASFYHFLELNDQPELGKLPWPRKTKMIEDKRRKREIEIINRIRDRLKESAKNNTRLGERVREDRLSVGIFKIKIAR